MEAEGRQEYLQKITKILVIFTAGCLAVLSIWFYVVLPSMEVQRTYLVSIVFVAGLVGGFVSIQQRLPSIEMGELKSLSRSVSSILLIPINGGIFAIVLMLIFLAGIMEGAMFPTFEHVKIDHAKPVESYFKWFSETSPKAGSDIAKLLFWSFVAGFSERFVPQIIRRTQQDSKPE